MPARSTPGPLLGLALRCLIRSGKGKGAAQTCRAPCNHSAHHGPGQVPVRWATAATGSCSRLQNTPSAAHPVLLVAVPALVPAHCAVPPGLLHRAHRRPSPLRLPLLSLGLSSLALFLFFSPLPIASLSFLSTTAIYRANRLQAGQSLFFWYCLSSSQSFLFARCFCEPAAPVTHCLCPSGWHCIRFLPAFSGFLVLPGRTSIDKAIWPTFSRSRVFFLWKEKLPIGVKQNKTKQKKKKNKIHILMAIGISRRL